MTNINNYAELVNLWEYVSLGELVLEIWNCIIKQWAWPLFRFDCPVWHVHENKTKKFNFSLAGLYRREILTFGVKMFKTRKISDTISCVWKCRKKYLPPYNTLPRIAYTCECKYSISTWIIGRNAPLSGQTGYAIQNVNFKIFPLTEFPPSWFSLSTPCPSVCIVTFIHIWSSYWTLIYGCYTWELASRDQWFAVNVVENNRKLLSHLRQQISWM